MLGKFLMWLSWIEFSVCVWNIWSRHNHNTDWLGDKYGNFSRKL